MRNQQEVPCKAFVAQALLPVRMCGPQAPSPAQSYTSAAKTSAWQQVAFGKVPKGIWFAHLAKKEPKKLAA